MQTGRRVDDEETFALRRLPDRLCPIESGDRWGFRGPAREPPETRALPIGIGEANSVAGGGKRAGELGRNRRLAATSFSVGD
jgi:hypothetical protein